jgi:hypothetical protein
VRLALGTSLIHGLTLRARFARRSIIAELAFWPGTWRALAIAIAGVFLAPVGTVAVAALRLVAT